MHFTQQPISPLHLRSHRNPWYGDQNPSSSIWAPIGLDLGEKTLALDRVDRALGLKRVLRRGERGWDERDLRWRWERGECRAVIGTGGR